jgi:hypothetical protein
MDWSSTLRASTLLFALAAPVAAADWSAQERFTTQAAPASSCATCIQRLPGGGWRIADDEGGLAAFASDGSLQWRVDPRIDGVRARSYSLALAADGSACLLQWRINANSAAVVASRVNAVGQVIWRRQVAASPAVEETAHAVHCQADGGALLALGDRVQRRDAMGELVGEHRLADARRVRAAIGNSDDGLVAVANAVDGTGPLTLQRYAPDAGLVAEQLEDIAPSTSFHALLADAQGGIALARVRHGANGAAVEIAVTRLDAELRVRWRGNVAVSAPVNFLHARAQDDGGLAVSAQLDDATEGLQVGWWGADGFRRWAPFFPGNHPEDGGNLRFAAASDGTLWFALSRGAGTIWRTDVRQVLAGGTLALRRVIEGPAALGIRRIDLAGPSRIELLGIAGIAEDPSQPVAAATVLDPQGEASVLFRGLPVPAKGVARAIAVDGDAIVGAASMLLPVGSMLRTVAWSLDGSERQRREAMVDGEVRSARGLVIASDAMLQVARIDPQQGPDVVLMRRLGGSTPWVRTTDAADGSEVVDLWREAPDLAIALLGSGRLLRIGLDGSGITSVQLAMPSVPQGVRRETAGGSTRLLAWNLGGPACWARAFDANGAPLAGVDAACPQFVPFPDVSQGWATLRADGGWILVTAGIEMFFQRRLRYIAHAPNGALEATRSAELAATGTLRVAANPGGTAVMVGAIASNPPVPTRVLRFTTDHALAFDVSAPAGIRPDGVVHPSPDGGVEGLGFTGTDGRQTMFRLQGNGALAGLAHGKERLAPEAIALVVPDPVGMPMLLAAGQASDPAPDRNGHATFLRAAAPLFASGFEAD